MKILMLFPYAPMPPPLDLAGTRRNLPFFLELAKYNSVSVLSYGTREQEKIFTQTYGHLCKKVKFVDNKRPRLINGLGKIWLLLTGRSTFRQLYRSDMQNAINEMTASEAYDIIHCCVQMFGYFKFPDGIPISSDTHEVKYDLLYRASKITRNLFWKAFTYLSYRIGKKEEIVLCKKFNLLITTTERDRELFKKDLPELHIKAIEMGAGSKFFENPGITPEPFTMTFTGLFTHLPNRQGIIYFLDEIFPIILNTVPEARIYIVGKGPTKEILRRSAENTIITGFVDDVRPYVAKAQIFVIPLLAGGGIRGKALEAMAMKRPIVTTSIGVEGINLKDGLTALFGDTPRDFADAVVRLFANPESRMFLSKNAYQVAVNQYTWEQKGKELDKTLRNLVQDYYRLNVKQRFNTSDKQACLQ